MKSELKSGAWAIMVRSMVQIVRRPLMWVAMIGLPLFLILFVTSMFEKGLPTRIPAAIVDRDGTAMSRSVTQTLGSMQMVDMKMQANSFSEARHAMQEGKIYGYFLIPENFEADLLAGRGPAISFYTNMVYYVPGTLLFKTFKSTAVFTKAGLAAEVANAAGQNPEELAPVMQPVNIVSRPIGNPLLNYGIYLCNSFVPCILQLMIMLVTCFSLGQEIKYGTSVRLMRMAKGSVFRAVYAKLFPQTVIWWVIAVFMESWLYKWNHYPMHGTWLWMTMSELMFVLACQGFGVFLFGMLPNLRLSLSVSALLGILSFSIGAFSFPIESMYGGVAIFSYIVPVRYNFLIYIDHALNGLPLYYSRWWFVAYIVFMLSPLITLRRTRKAFCKPVYVP